MTDLAAKAPKKYTHPETGREITFEELAEWMVDRWVDSLNDDPEREEAARENAEVADAIDAEKE